MEPDCGCCGAGVVCASANGAAQASATAAAMLDIECTRFMETSLRDDRPGLGSRCGRTCSHHGGGLATSRRAHFEVKAMATRHSAPLNI
jgi:threonine dehydratase